MKCAILLLGALAVSPVVLAGDPAAAQGTPAANGALVRQLNDSFADVFEKVAPSVVVIEATRSPDRPIPGMPRGFDFFLRRPDGSSVPAEPNVGSGFLFRADGYILTNNHVVDLADKIVVRLKDGRRFDAAVAGVDDRTDLAVLKIAADNLRVADLGDSDAVRVGQFAFAIGTPLELPYTFTVGVISAKDRSLGGAYGELLQTDASINPGNSGGPLANIDGQIIGINTLISGMNRGLGFAIPINVAKNVANQLIAEGRVRRPWLGIAIAGIEEAPQFQQLFPGLARGVVVERIEPNTPAESSDLRAGDVILKVDGVEVGLAAELQKQILAKSIGQAVSLDIWRQGRKVQIEVSTGERPDFQRASIRPQRNPTGPKAGASGTPEISAGSPGLLFRDCTPEAAQELGLTRAPTAGALVTTVAESTPAAVAGIEVGDVITDAGGVPITKASDLERQLSLSDNKDGILLLIDRRGTRTFAILKP